MTTTKIIEPPKFAPRPSISDGMSPDDLWEYACLVGYRYKLSEHDKLQSTLASQPKAPAPVPVVQGEAVFEVGFGWLKPAGHYPRGTLLYATPTMVGGAGGGVVARIVVQARKLLTELDDYFKRTKTLDVNVAYRCDKLESALNATPAPEQATTGSGQGVTDAERLDVANASLSELGDVLESVIKENSVPMSDYLAGVLERCDAAILSTASPAGAGAGEVRP